MLLNIIFRRWEILLYFLSCDLENQPIFSLACLSATSFKIWILSAFFYISETTLHIIFIMYITEGLKLSLRLIHCNILKFQDKPILRTCQKSASTFTVLTLC